MEEQDLLFEYLKTISEEISHIKETLNNEVHKEEHEYLKALIKREKDRADLRKAIIEKSVSGLIWTFIITSVTFIWNTARGKQ